MVFNSLITSRRRRMKPGKVMARGLAWDAGCGIRSVGVSTDGGKIWSWATTSAATLSGPGVLN
jgi:hypothetical protein